MSLDLHTQNPRSQPSVTTSLVEVTHILSRKRPMPCRVFFKNEYEQPSGSFKLRGIGYMIGKELERERARDSGSRSRGVRVFASSGGNAGLAAAYTSKYYGVACTVVVPGSCKSHIISKLKEYGAKVVVYGNSIEDACVHARLLMESCRESPIFCHPFDNPLIWEGHSQIVTEIFSQLSLVDRSRVKAVACSVGGGGLYNGISSGLQHSRSRAQCLLAETKQAPTLHSAVQAGKVVTLEQPQTIATSLACSYVSPETLKLFQSRKDELHMVDDLCAVRASLEFQRDFGIYVEPACGAALSFVYEQVSKLESMALAKDDILVVVVCGGLCANEDTFVEYRKMVRQNKM